MALENRTSPSLFDQVTQAPGLAQENQGVDLLGLLEMLGQQKQQSNNQLFTHFGFKSKPSRVIGFGGGTVDPMTGQSQSRGLDQFYAANPHHRQGENFAQSTARQQRGNSANRLQDMLKQDLATKSLLDQFQ
tara:strand:- start:21625 stop:22020 length:396 start_codon:yes stop_codon:yes gene_type:complete